MADETAGTSGKKGRDLRKFSREMPRRQGFEERGSSARGKVGDLMKLSRDLDRLKGARDWDWRNFCADI